MAHLHTLLTINDLAWKLYNSNPNHVPKRNMNPTDITHLLRSLFVHDVKCILVGGFAMAFYGFPRATGDIDLWIESSPENMVKLRDALIAFGFKEASALQATTQLVPGMGLFHFLDSDFQIDLLHNLKRFKETDFDLCYSRATVADYEGIAIHVLDADDMLTEKTANNRPKDVIDVLFLKEQLKKK